MVRPIWVSRSCIFFSMSFEATVTVNSRFRPSAVVSVICILLGCPLKGLRRPAAHAVDHLSGVVRAGGFEPPRPRSLEPKSSASANSATPARRSDPACAEPHGPPLPGGPRFLAPRTGGVNYPKAGPRAGKAPLSAPGLPYL